MLKRRNFLLFSLGLTAGAVMSAASVVAYYKFIKLRPARLTTMSERTGATSPTAGWILTEDDIVSFQSEGK